MSRKVDFKQTRVKKEAERLVVTAATFYYPVPTIKLKPTARPKFNVAINVILINGGRNGKARFER